MTEGKNPLISVIMPVYNGAEYLSEAIESILNQTYPHFEFIVVNDGSVDSSEDVVNSFKDDRIVYIKNESNKGLVYSLNKAISLSKGQYIARMDADDVSDSKRFQKQIHEFEKDSSLVICGSFFKTFGNGSKDFISHIPVTHEQIISSIFFACPFAHPSVMIRKDALLILNEFYREDYKHSEDYDLWSRLVFLGNAKNIPEYLLNYRVHKNQVSTVFEEAKYQNVSKIQRNLLEQISIEPNAMEMAFFLNLYKGVSKKDVTYLQMGLCFLENLHRHFVKKFPGYYPTHSVLLVSRWFKICGNSGLGFLNIQFAFKLSFLHLRFIKLKDLLKLIYKSIIGYSQLDEKSI